MKTGLPAVAGKPPGSPAELNVKAAHLGDTLNPGAVAVGLFVDPQFAGKIEDGIRNAGAQILTAGELKRIGTGPGAARARERPRSEGSCGSAGSGAWFPILRLCVPHQEVVDATWECPPIRRVD